MCQLKDPRVVGALCAAPLNVLRLSGIASGSCVTYISYPGFAGSLGRTSCNPSELHHVPSMGCNYAVISASERRRWPACVISVYDGYKPVPAAADGHAGFTCFSSVVFFRFATVFDLGSSNRQMPPRDVLPLLPVLLPCIWREVISPGCQTASLSHRAS